MRIVTPPYNRSFLELDAILSKSVIQEFKPQKEIIICPRCINGRCKEGIDGNSLILTCINCGWQRERERYAPVL